MEMIYVRITLFRQILKIQMVYAALSVQWDVPVYGEGVLVATTKLVFIIL